MLLLCQMVLLPWGWTTSKPANYDNIYNLAMEAAQALQSASASIFDTLLLGHYLLRKRAIYDVATVLM